ncbi:MAG: radical SAM protein [Nitrospirae bacterium]|nr:radical SAM protein [Nitrospirota bacterium]
MYSPLRHAGSIFSKKKPLHLTFFLTRRCNSGCPFCFYLKSNEAPSRGEPELSLEEIKKISGGIGELLWLAFSGGEIFLREDLVGITKTFYENNRPAVILLPTNGLLPEVIRDNISRILRDCPKSIIVVKLSMDGLYERHDELRNTKGSFEKMMQTYSLLRDFLRSHPNFELGINTVFSSKNQDEMDGIIDFVKGMKDIRTHTISLIRGDLCNEEYLNGIDVEKYHRAISRLECGLKDGTAATYRFKGGKVKAAQDILQRRLIHETGLKKKRLIPCYAGQLNLVVLENGDVFPCEILPKKMGNLREAGYDIRKILESARAKEIIRSIKNKECFCTHECYFLTNILFNPGLYPALLKEYVGI